MQLRPRLFQHLPLVLNAGSWNEAGEAACARCTRHQTAVWFGAFAHLDRQQAWRPNPQSQVGGAVRNHLKPDAYRLLGMQHALLVKPLLIGSDDRLDIGRNSGGIGYQ